MKNFKNYIKENKQQDEIKLTDYVVTLEGLDEQIAEKFKGLDGQQISECGLCGCECDCEKVCCDPCPCTAPIAPGESKGADVYFYSSSEVMTCLKGMPKCDILRRIHFQYSGAQHTFAGENKLKSREPLYFEDWNYIAPASNTTVEPMNFYPLFNKKLYDFVKKIVEDNKLVYPVIVNNAGKEIQVFVLKEVFVEMDEDWQTKNIKKSLEETAKLLGKLEGNDDVVYCQVADIAISGNYSYKFLVTFTINPENFQITDEEISKLLKDNNPK